MNSNLMIYLIGGLYLYKSFLKTTEIMCDLRKSYVIKKNIHKLLSIYRVNIKFCLYFSYILIRKENYINNLSKYVYNRQKSLLQAKGNHARYIIFFLY